MKSPKLYIVVLSASLFFAGCEEDVREVKLPPFEQKLVINSFISPSDSVSMFFVSSNRRIYGETGVKEETGKITGTISDGTLEVALDSVRSGLKVSRGKMQIEYGKSYTLKVVSNKGLKATASCVVPQKREFLAKVDTFSVAPPVIPDIYFPRSVKFIFSFRDIAGEKNYYRIGGKSTIYYVSETTGEHKVHSANISFEKEYITDAGNDGKDLTNKTVSGIYYSAYDSAFLEVYLFNLEKSYYLYHRSLKNYNSDENPFSENSPVYSNISGGLGIFTSYTVDTLVFRLK